MGAATDQNVDGTSQASDLMRQEHALTEAWSEVSIIYCSANISQSSLSKALYHMLTIFIGDYKMMDDLKLDNGQALAHRRKIANSRPKFTNSYNPWKVEMKYLNDKLMTSDEFAKDSKILNMINKSVVKEEHTKNEILYLVK